MDTLLKCRKFEVYREDIPGHDGKSHPKEFIRHPGAAVILPLLDEHTCLILRQFRPALKKELWELPAGTLDKPGEDPKDAAAREVEEETGYRAGRLDYLCEFYPSPGISTELIRAYVARDLSKTAQHLDETEQLTVERLSVDEALNMVRDGRIVDAKTIITLLRWESQRRRPA